MQTRRLGNTHVSAIGLGAMPMSLENRPEEAQSIRTVHAALDAGVTLIDTADAYCTNKDETGHNERLIAKALDTWSGDRDNVVVATKGGMFRPGDGSWQTDGSPAHLKEACEASLRALGTDRIDLYQFHRPDPRVPYEDSVGAIWELQDAGKIRFAGISNANVEQIRLATDILQPLVSVQNEFSPRFRSSADELALCGDLGIAFLPWSPLGGIGRAGALGQKHDAFAEVAAEHGVSPQQVALAWELAQGEHVLPIPGSSRPETILDSVGAADLELSEEDLARLGRG